jgi:hypothetical protein
LLPYCACVTPLLAALPSVLCPPLSLVSLVEHSPLNITDVTFLYSIPTHTDKMPRKAAEPKEAKPAGEKKASGLTKPCTLSAELAAIVGAKKDEKLAR